MKVSQFVKIVQLKLHEEDPDIDYIDVDICYKGVDVEIIVEPGRENNTIKIYAK